MDCEWTESNDVGLIKKMRLRLWLREDWNQWMIINNYAIIFLIFSANCAANWPSPGWQIIFDTKQNKTKVY